MASRVVVCECCLGPDHPAFAMLKDQGVDLVSCSDSHDLLEEVVRHRPAVVIYGLRPDSTENMGVLKLLRRAVPDAALVLLASEGSLSTQKLVQSFRPIYYAVCPVEATELRDAVAAALARAGRAESEGGR